MNNEPVAWIRHKEQNGEVRWEMTGIEPPLEVIENMGWKPLNYQTQELSDEKILLIAKRYTENMDSFGNRSGIPEEDILNFVRELLEKTQEK